MTHRKLLNGTYIWHSVYYAANVGGYNCESWNKLVKCDILIKPLFFSNLSKDFLVGGGGGHANSLLSDMSIQMTRGHYHESSDCFEYPNKTYLKQATQNNTCQMFPPKKISKSRIDGGSVDHPRRHQQYPPPPFPG